MGEKTVIKYFEVFERGNGNSLRRHEEEYPCLCGVGESRGGCSVCVYRHTERACARASERASEKERHRHIDRDKERREEQFFSVHKHTDKERTGASTCERETRCKE
jgi:hypothetical protein